MSVIAKYALRMTHQLLFLLPLLVPMLPDALIILPDIYFLFALPHRPIIVKKVISGLKIFHTVPCHRESGKYPLRIYIWIAFSAWLWRCSYDDPACGQAASNNFCDIIHRMGMWIEARIVALVSELWMRVAPRFCYFGHLIILLENRYLARSIAATLMFIASQ